MLRAVKSVPLIVLAIGAAHGQDTVRVRATGAPVWGTRITLTQAMTLGALDGPPEYALGRITALAADRHNRFFTYDAKDKQIRAYDANGKFVRLVGRSGAGPGEYRSVTGMGLLNDTTLVVFDVLNARITLFNPAGSVLRTIPQSRLTGQMRRGATVDRSGLISYLARPIISRGSNAGANGQVVRLAPDGSLVDSTPLPTLSEPQISQFLPQTHLALSPSGGIVFGKSDRYRFVIRPAKGPVRVVERSWTPVPMGSAEHEAWLEWAAFLDKREGRSLGIVVPKSKPAYLDLISDSDGRIWVSLYMVTEKKDASPAPGGEPTPWLAWRQNETYDVFDPAGPYLGRVGLPPDSQLLWAQGDRIWVRAKGGADEDRILSYTLSGIRR